jgi:hypothetical protein
MHPITKALRSKRWTQFNTLGLKSIYVIFNNSAPTENILRLSYEDQLFSSF